MNARLLARRIAQAPASFIREILKVTEQPGIISFAGGLPNEALFPLEEIRLASEAVLGREGRTALQYSTSEGHAGLREWIAERYRQRFGLHIPVQQILVTNGSQQALDLLGKVLLDPGDPLLLEAPGYLGAIQAFGLYEPRFVPLPLGDEGPEPDALQTALTQYAPKLFYTVPNFQNPTGISYSEVRRHELAVLLRDKPCLLIEDDPYGELRYHGSEASSFKQLLPEQTVLLGSFSKTVMPGFRLGWIVAPPWLMEKLVIAKQSADLHSSSFTQHVLHRYLCDNDHDRHLQRLTECYGSQQRAMLDAIDRHFPKTVRYTRPQGGMFIWSTLPPGVSAMTLLQSALQHQVAFVPGHPFYIGGVDSNELRLNFTNADAATIERGIERLGGVMGEAVPRNVGG
jgi:2-aminoadipate transaminase